jgi:hypothetical protein
MDIISIVVIIILLLTVYIYANITTIHGYAVSKNEANLAILLNFILIILLVIPLIQSQSEYYNLIIYGLIVGISIINLILLARLGNSGMDNNSNIQLVYLTYSLSVLFIIYYLVNFFISTTKIIKIDAEE